MKSWIAEMETMQFGKGVMSQGYQDVLLNIIFENIPLNNTPGFCVEFGFDGNSFSEGYGANSAALVLNQGWNNLYLDGSHANEEINLHRHFLTPSNITDVFRQHNVPPVPDYVSIDVDSIDLWLFRAILKEYRASVFSVEYNCNFPLSAAITANEEFFWNCDRAYGASLKALNMVAEEHGYVLLWVVPTLDVFFIRRDLVDDGSPSICFPLSKWAGATGLPYHPPVRERERLDCFLDYETFQRSGGDITASRRDAKAVCRRWLMESCWETIALRVCQLGRAPLLRECRKRLAIRTRIRKVLDCMAAIVRRA